MKLRTAMRLWVLSCSPLQRFIPSCVLLRGCWGKVNKGIMRLQWLLRTRVNSIGEQEAATSVLVHNGETSFVLSPDDRKELKLTKLSTWSWPQNTLIPGQPWNNHCICISVISQRCLSSLLSSIRSVIHPWVTHLCYVCACANIRVNLILWSQQHIETSPRQTQQQPPPSRPCAGGGRRLAVQICLHNHSIIS